MRDMTSIKLENGIAVKGSFTRIYEGCYIDLYVMSKSGDTLGRYTFTVHGELSDAQARLKQGVSAMATLLKTYKVDQMKGRKALEVIVPFIIQRSRETLASL